MWSRGDDFRNNLVAGFSALMLLFAFGYGIFFSGFDKYYFAPAILLVTIVAGLALVPGLKSGWAFPSSGAARCLFGFWAWMAISLLWSRVPNISMIFCLTLGSLPLLFFTLTQSRNCDQTLKICRVALIGGITLLAVWADIQFIFLSDLAGDRVHHPMLNANNLAVVVAIGIFMVLPLFAQAGRAGQIGWGVLILAYILAIMAAQSRGSMLGFFVAAGAFTLVNFGVVKARWRSFGFLALGLAVEASVFFLTVQSRYGFTHLGGGGDAAASNQNRIYLWSAGLKMLADHPFRGSGLGTFYLTYPAYRPFADTSDGFFVHMDPLQFGIEMGLPAILFFYGFAISVLLRTMKALRLKASPLSPRIEMMGAFGGLLVLLINSHLDFDLYMLPSLLLAALLLCLWYRASEMILPPARHVFFLRHWKQAALLAPILALVFVAGPVFITRAGIAVYDDGMAAQSMQAGNLDAGAKYAAHALRYGPENYDRAYLIDALWRGQQFQQNFVSLETEERQQMFTDTMNLLDKTLQYNPYNVQALNYKALLSFIAYPRADPDGQDHARAFLEQAVALDPINFDIRMGMAKLNLAQGRVLDAISGLEDGLHYDIAQMYAPGAYKMLLAEAKQRNGDVAEAQAIMAPVAERDKAMQDWRIKKAGIDSWVDQKVKTLLDH